MEEGWDAPEADPVRPQPLGGFYSSLSSTDWLLLKERLSTNPTVMTLPNVFGQEQERGSSHSFSKARRKGRCGNRKGMSVSLIVLVQDARL